MPSVSVPARPVMAPHRKFTVDDYHRMARAEIFGAEERLELIEGELIPMPPIGAFHAGVANRLIQFFTPRLAGRVIACAQNPIGLGNHSEPQPDFALLRYRSDAYTQALPTPGEVLLVVEIADTSVRYDRKVKRPLYARHGIPEYWLIDLRNKRIEVFLAPDREQGRYREIRTLSSGPLAPAEFPDLVLEVADLLN